MTRLRDPAELRVLLSRVLAYGVSAAALLLLIGLGSALAVGWDGSLVGANAASRTTGDFSGIVAGLQALRPVAIAQLGLLVLLATPVLRVATSVIAFAAEGDRLYAVISCVVLAILLTSIFLVR